MKQTPQQVLEALAASAPRARYVPPTKATQQAWREQWVVKLDGYVVYVCKTWNPDAETLAKARAERVGGTAELVAAGETADNGQPVR